MKIGITNTYYCETYGFEKGLERLKKHGYDGIDYQGFIHTESPLFQKDASEFGKQLQKESEIIKSCGLEVHQAHGPWRVPPRDLLPEDRAERFEKMKRSIEGAAILECKNLILHPLMPYTWEDKGYEKETWDINLEFMGKLTQIARRNDVVICFENMPFRAFSLSTVPQILEFVHMINDAHFKVCLDTGHTQVCGLSAGDAVRMIGKEKLRAVHMHDNDGNGDYHWNLFQGVTDWEDFGKAMGEIDFEGTLSLEVGIKKLPEGLCEYEEIGVYKKAEYIRRMA